MEVGHAQWIYCTRLTVRSLVAAHLSVVYCLLVLKL